MFDSITLSRFFISIMIFELSEAGNVYWWNPDRVVELNSAVTL